MEDRIDNGEQLNDWGWKKKSSLSHGENAKMAVDVEQAKIGWN